MVEKRLLGKKDVWDIKQYVCKAKRFDIETGKRIVLFNKQDAIENDIYVGYRVGLKHGNRVAIGIVDLTDHMVEPGQVGIFKDLQLELGLKDEERIEIRHIKKPESVDYIKKKMDKIELKPSEISTVMDELMRGYLGEIELASFVSAIYINGVTDEEVIGLTDSIVKSGDTLNLGRHLIADKHCIGGVAGNRTTMVLVPIIAAAGISIPKASSRSITSAAGTADTMEVLSGIDFSIEEMRHIVKKANGCIVWGGGTTLASADDLLIKIRHPLSLDPKGLLLASILAKKKSVGANHVIIDIPVGIGAKLHDMADANALGADFVKIGRRLGMSIDVLITDGNNPIGRGIGPVLECIDVLNVLSNSGPGDLREKSCILAGRLLEMCGKAKKGLGYAQAASILESGAALRKMRQIIELQGGDGDVRPADLPIGHCHEDIIADRSGKLVGYDNRTISRLARAAGAPNDKGAGILLFKEPGEKVRSGEKIMRLYAESESKLDFALKAMKKWETYTLQKIILNELG